MGENFHEEGVVESNHCSLGETGLYRSQPCAVLSYTPRETTPASVVVFVVVVCLADSTRLSVTLACGHSSGLAAWTSVDEKQLVATFFTARKNE